jgi:hypothetical protein
MQMKKAILTLLFLFCCLQFFAQEKNKHTTDFLSKAYIGVNIGQIYYPFTTAHMKQGYSVQSIRIPHTAVRLILFGYQFNKNLSGHISYMRPVDWVQYRNVNGSQLNHTVWMNVAGLTMKYQTKLANKFSFYTEGGLGIITRNGFVINQVPVVDDANYATILAGAGLQYHLTNKWDLQAHAVWSPENKKSNQPATFFYSAGFNYRMAPTIKVKKADLSGKKYFFPKNMIQVAYTSNGPGYGVNQLASDMVIFWGGEVEIKKGLSVYYKRNVFHTRKSFSFDWGASAGIWTTRKNNEQVFTLSLYPVFRITAIRTNPADIYFNYSVAGPTFISKPVLDGRVTGRKFTFFDFMGMGAYFGKERKLNTEINIMHYSNGNIYPVNAGLKIPLTFSLGYTF